jgi:uncharacterized protein (DUF924 family)
MRGPKDVQRDPQDILAFWFGDAARDPAEASARSTLWFSSSQDVDSEIRERFTPTVEAAARGELDYWLQEPHSALALVLLLDQFPRNIWRGSAEAFAHDGEALRVAREAVSKGLVAGLAPLERWFLLLPYQHSESLDDQRESLSLFSEIVETAPEAWQSILERYLEYARQHLELIARFGRFPHRNRILGRTPTAEEETYLAEGGATFGQAAH